MHLFSKLKSQSVIISSIHNRNQSLLTAAFLSENLTVLQRYLSSQPTVKVEHNCYLSQPSYWQEAEAKSQDRYDICSSKSPTKFGIWYHVRIFYITSKGTMLSPTPASLPPSFSLCLFFRLFCFTTVICSDYTESLEETEI